MVSYVITVAFFPYLCYCSLVVEDVAAQGFIQHQLYPGGAVVLDEIIFIVAVFGQRIVCQEGVDLGYLLRGQVQLLFHHTAVLCKGVVLEFPFEFYYAEEIIKLSMDKLGDKLGVGKVKGAEVVDNVDAVFLVHIAEGGVAEGRVDGVARVHCNQAELRLCIEGSGGKE